MRDYPNNTPSNEAIDNFTASLHEWAEQAPAGENRVEAAARMVNAFRRNATYLNLESFGLSSLPPQIGNLTNLTLLNLSDNRLNTVPESIGNLTNLTYLNLSYNRLNTVPESIGNLTNLTQLNLSDNRLNTVPESIGNLTNLRYLTLADNQLTTVPESIGNLTNLTTHLNLSYNRLNTVPDSIRELANLKELNLSHNQLNTLPESIGNLTNLRYLTLADNQLNTLPESIGNLTNLTVLHLTHNQLTTTPETLLTTRHNDGFRITLEQNRITQEEAVRLNQLITDSGSGVRLDISIYETPRLNASRNTNILDTILNSAAPDRKEALRSFVTNDTSDDFKRFLQETARTSSWREHQEQMTPCLLAMIEKMQNNPQKKVHCEQLASTAFGTCGDRVAFTFAQMQIALDFPDIPINDMTLAQLHEAAKPQAITTFLLEAAQDKVDALTRAGGTLDEIEVYLAYLQPAAQLGVNLDGINMLYRACSNVSDQDLRNVVSDIQNIGVDQLSAQHIYHDGILRQHLDVQSILTEVGNREEFDASQLEGESDQAFIQRCETMQNSIQQASINAILNAATQQNTQEAIVDDMMESQALQTQEATPEEITPPAQAEERLTLSQRISSAFRSMSCTSGSAIETPSPTPETRDSNIVRGNGSTGRGG